jgi:hypothetical protein
MDLLLTPGLEDAGSDDELKAVAQVNTDIQETTMAEEIRDADRGT